MLLILVKQLLKSCSVLLSYLTCMKSSSFVSLLHNAFSLHNFMDTSIRLFQIFVCYSVGFSCLIIPGSGSLPFEEQLCLIQCQLFCKNQSLDLKNAVCTKCSMLQKEPDLFNCSNAECSGRCQMFQNLTVEKHLPMTPKLEFSFLSVFTIRLHWLQSSDTNEITYLIQKKENEKWTEEKQLNKNFVIISNLDVCTIHKYRIIAINKYGSSSASNEITIDKPKIGKIKNVRLLQNWHFDNVTSEFKAVIKCEIPEGWREADIDRCSYGVSRKNCPQHFNSPEQFSLYFDMKDKTHTQLRILSEAFSCTYDIQANIYSRCNEKGESFYYKLNLTECSAIRDFVCPTEPFNPPGIVEDVQIHVSYDGNVDIGWKPPSDLGTVGVVNSYGIRWGKVKLEIDMMDFITLSSAAHVSTVQLNFTRISLKRYEPHKIYGIQIIALYPGQSFGVDEWDMYTVYPFCYKGEADLNIDSESNLRQVNVSWVTARWPEKECSNLTRIEMYKRYAVRWGPADSTDVQSMTIKSLEGTAIFSVNTSLLFNITQPGVPYGMMVIPVKCKGYSPTDEDWKNATSYSFIVQSEIQEQTKKLITWRFVAIGLGIGVSLMIIIIGALIYRRKQTKNIVQLNEEHPMSSHIYYVQSVERYLPHGHVTGTVETEERSWEVPYQSLRFQDELGRGAFGKVFKAEINSCWLLRNEQSEGEGRPKRLTVAVKMLHESAKEIFQMDFIREIQVMKKIGYHKNIVSMLGCCSRKRPICLIVEHIPLGDLLSYLRNQRHNIKNVEDRKEEEEEEEEEEDFSVPYANCSDHLTSSKLLSMARQIASGMEFLSSKGFVHRDLAARNVLVGEDLTLKIGDFGLTRYIYNDKVYVNLKGGKLPVKWMSIEAIFDRTFSTASDVHVLPFTPGQSGSATFKFFSPDSFQNSDDETISTGSNAELSEEEMFKFAFKGGIADKDLVRRWF